MWSTGPINSKIKLNYSIISHKFEIDYRTTDADRKLLQKKNTTNCNSLYL